jgi:hypothetical protein
MRCVVLQPSYIPWRGYFHQIRKADVFVFYDDVQYDRGGWRNRNRIKTPGGSRWLTVPVHSRGHQFNNTPISEIRLACGTPAGLNHWRVIEAAYRSAPHFERYEPLVRRFYERDDEYLADFTIATTIELAKALGVGETRFVRSSSLGIGGTRNERLMGLLKEVGATHYISGPSAKSYLDEDLFRESDVVLEYMDYKYPEYPQLHSAYDEFVSILDLLFMTGPEAAGYIWDDLL